MDDRQPNPSACLFRHRPGALANATPTARTDQHRRAADADSTADVPATAASARHEQHQPTPITDLTGPAPSWMTPQNDVLTVSAGQRTSGLDHEDCGGAVGAVSRAACGPRVVPIDTREAVPPTTEPAAPFVGARRGHCP
nr:hypothetical protein asmbl_6 [uncultured bacterium]